MAVPTRTGCSAAPATTRSTAGTGDDWLFGNKGADEMTGDEGADLFIIGGGDTITDFELGTDKLVTGPRSDSSTEIFESAQHNGEGGVTLTLNDAGDTVTLENTSMGEITDADLLFG